MSKILSLCSGSVTEAWESWRAFLQGEPEQLVMSHD